MVKRILLFNNEEDKIILNKNSEEVNENENYKELIQDLKDTLNSTINGRGISAVQIGVLKKICICK